MKKRTGFLVVLFVVSLLAAFWHVESRGQGLTSPFVIAGSDGTVARIPTVSSTGQSAVNISQINGATPTIASGAISVNTEGTKVTYRGAINWSPVATAATDIFTITGSATRTVRVTRLGVSCTATTAIATDILFIKRSTANSGGTSAGVGLIPLDSNDAAATATVLIYTANPTLGTTIGTVSIDKASITTTTGAPQFYVEDFSTRNSRAIVLRGTAQVLAINLNGSSLAGIACAAEVEWTEE